MNVSIWNYTGRNTESYAVDVGSLTLFFSYKTVVAFTFRGEFSICENIWSVTTGRHLNELNDDKSVRLPHSEFTSKLESILDRMEVSYG